MRIQKRDGERGRGLGKCSQVVDITPTTKPVAGCLGPLRNLGRRWVKGPTLQIEKVRLGG